MEAILEYIMANYTWFLGSAILILLAIIGSYADKTNFGQGKETDIKNNQQTNLDKLIQENNVQNLMDSKELIKQEIEIENISQQQNNLNMQLESNSDLIKTPESVSQTINSNVELDKEINFDDEFKKFDEEFDELVPQKEIVNNGLLEEIENLSLDKTQNLNLSDIPDLDDVELPKIKSFDSEQQDIWKF